MPAHAPLMARADDAALHGETGVPRRIGVVARRPATCRQHCGRGGSSQAPQRRCDQHTEMEPSPTRQQREVSVLAEPLSAGF